MVLLEHFGCIQPADTPARQDRGQWALSRRCNRPGLAAWAGFSEKKDAFVKYGVRNR
jgi:hypothetical protein